MFLQLFFMKDRSNFRDYSIQRQWEAPSRKAYDVIADNWEVAGRVLSTRKASDYSGSQAGSVFYRGFQSRIPRYRGIWVNYHMITC